MEKNLLKYVWKHSRRQQLWMLVVVAVSMPLYFMSLDLPKRIINGPVQGTGFEQQGDKQKFLTIDLPFGEWLTGNTVPLLEGFSLDRQGMLLALCFAFLAMVFINGWVKLYINTYKGRMGERILRRLRYELFDRVLRFPIQHVRRVKPSEVTSVIKDEVEPLGEFIGDAFTLPIFLGGQAITGLTFLFLQNYFFGFVTLGIVLFQAWLIPMLRRRLLELGRERQKAARQLAGSIGETVQGMDDVHLNDTSNLARARISSMLGRIFSIRFELYQRKFSVKFINNFLIQFLAFLFYAIGGYFVINGQMDLGALVASIAAYKDLPAPIKGLIDWDQLRLMNQVRYEQAIDDLASAPVDPPERQRLSEADIPAISRGYTAEGLSVADSSGTPILEAIGAELGRGETIALIGDSHSGVNRFAEVLVRLLPRSSGRIRLDDAELDDLPEHLTGRRIGYADGTTFFAGATIFEALCEPLMNQPLSPVGAGSNPEQDDFEIAEARRSGNFVGAASDAWIDRRRIGVDDDNGFSEHIRNVMTTAGLYDDVLQFGLRLRLPDSESDEVRQRVLEVRSRFAEELSGSGLGNLVELLNPDKYNKQLSIGENIVFGTTRDESFDPFSLEKNAIVREILVETGAEERLHDMGLEIARTNIELFGDLEEDSPMFEREGAVTPEQIEELRKLVDRTAKRETRAAQEKYREAALALTIDYIERESRFGLVDDHVQELILDVRKRLRARLENQKQDTVQFFDPHNYNPSLSILDNVLFGRIDGRRAGAQDRVITAITDLLHKTNLTGPVFRAGLTFDIGTGGRNLSDPQAQKLKLARALVKKPDILVINRALAALDSENRDTVLDNILRLARAEDGWEMGVLCVPVDEVLARKFDRVIRFERGTIVADGSFEELFGELKKAREDNVSGS